jgi:type II secretory pathway pseudopilin PulG
MKCRHCGNRVAKSDRHCVYCGLQVKKVPIWALSLLALAIVGITAGVLLSHFWPLLSRGVASLSQSTSDVEAANTELRNAQAAVAACLFDAGKASLTRHDPWDGTSGKVIADGNDATDFVRSTFKATYTFDANGTLITATNGGAGGSWKDLTWDSSNRRWKGT